MLITVAAGSLAGAAGCDRTPEHTINTPAVVHPTGTNPPPTPPLALDAGAAPVARTIPVGVSPNTPATPPHLRARDAGAAPVIRTPERRPLPEPTSNPPAPVMPRMPPGNG